MKTEVTHDRVRFLAENTDEALALNALAELSNLAITGTATDDSGRELQFVSIPLPSDDCPL
jgi:hypothetical protein